MPIFNKKNYGFLVAGQCSPGLFVGVGCVLAMVVACNSPQEAARVEIPVVLDAGSIKKVTTDLGYEVELSEARIVAQDLTFAVAGEAHVASLFQKPYQWLVPSAQAHPGHYQGGDITGELTGRFLLDWSPGADDPIELGLASLLVGTYTSANFVFESARKDDLDDDDDKLLGHTMIFCGTATKDKDEFAFLALIDSPEDRQLVGLPFEYEVKADSDIVIHFMLEPRDHLADDTMFDGLDFQALDEDADGEVHLLPTAETAALKDAYNLFRRTMQTHDYYFMDAVPTVEEAEE